MVLFNVISHYDLSSSYLSIVEVLIGAVLVATATDGILRVWFRGSIFAERRSKLEAQKSIHWWAKLMTCSQCMTVHVTLWLILATILPWALLGKAREFIWDLLLLPLWWWSSVSIARGLDWFSTVNPAEE